MSELRLILPDREYLESYRQACEEYMAHGVKDAFPHDPDRFDEWKNTIFSDAENERLGIGLPDGWVPATQFWLVDGEKYLGSGNLRHYLTPALEKTGGNIGYAVRPSEWRKGYATRLLGLMLPEAAALGIERVLLTCSRTNVASARVIEKNGGVLQDILKEPQRETCRYWIELRDC